MLKSTKRIIFTVIVSAVIAIPIVNLSLTVDIIAAEISPNQDNAIENSLDVKEEIKEESKEESKEENKEENLQADEIKPSEAALVNIELIEESEKLDNAVTFMLEFELGNEIVNGVVEAAIADTLYIEDLNFSLPLERMNSYITEFELSGLKNKKYRYYIKSMNKLEYEGYFEVNFVGIKPKVSFRGFPKKAVFEGTEVTLTMKTDNVESEMKFNGRKISGKKAGKAFQFTVSKNGSYKYIAKAGKKLTKGVLKVDFFKNIKNNLDVPLSYQHPAYPEGCESYATVAVLKYFGYKIEESEFISKYLDMISLWDKRVTKIKNLFDKYYLGDPSNKKYQGYLANPPVLVKAANKYFKKIKSKKYIAVDTTGKSLKELLDNEVLNNNPVVIWLTINNRRPYTARVRGVPYIFPSHTMVISGYDRKKKMVHLTDSISGNRSVSYDTANKLYKLTGKKSLILRAT